MALSCLPKQKNKNIPQTNRMIQGLSKKFQAMHHTVMSQTLVSKTNRTKIINHAILSYKTTFKKAIQQIKLLQPMNQIKPSQMPKKQKVTRIIVKGQKTTLHIWYQTNTNRCTILYNLSCKTISLMKDSKHIIVTLICCKIRWGLPQVLKRHIIHMGFQKKFNSIKECINACIVFLQVLKGQFSWLEKMKIRI